MRSIAFHVRLVAAVWIAATICFSAMAHAWDSKTHRFIASRAELLLLGAAKLGVEELLAADGKASLEEIAMWADAIRELDVGTQPLHSVRLPLDKSGYSVDRDCFKKQCALEALKASINALRYGNAHIDARVAALKYIVHLVGDIHQPLHAIKGIGEFPVIYQGKLRSFHDVWDRDITPITFLRQIGDIDANEFNYSGYQDIVSWAEESRDIARDQILPEVKRMAIGKRIVLSDGYAHENSSIAKERVTKSIVRLASLLNWIFNSPSSAVRK